MVTLLHWKLRVELTSSNRKQTTTVLQNILETGLILRDVNEKNRPTKRLLENSEEAS
jgi:hypothetical protein